MSNTREFRDLDRDALLSLILEKNKRIQDLEKSVEDQKRLRLQDSNQVEEKAARIKEWVTNKLKELENQNKQLREQNKKQKETVETLTNKLATLNIVSSPRKRNNPNIDSVQYIDREAPPSPIETIDVEKSLKTRRPQLKNTIHPSISSSSDQDDCQNLRITLSTSSTNNGVANRCDSMRSGGVSYISIGDNNNRVPQPPRQESPLYDSVNIELVNSEHNNNEHYNRNTSAMTTSQQNHKAQIEVKTITQQNVNSANFETSNIDPTPPPPPLHQYDRWELQLYNLAEKALSSMVEGRGQDDYDKGNVNVSRKSSSSLKHDITSVVRPSFTTIDGNQVVDDLCVGDLEQENQPRHNRISNDDNQSSQSSNSQNNATNTMRSRIGDLVKPENVEQKLMTQNLFDSPMRSRSGKDSILRTQSVRRNPAPEKLYDFIASDLVKRGYLIKHGALRSHSRWFVLRNFHLYSYKREAEETAKTNPAMTLKLEPTFTVQVSSQSNEGFPFKINHNDKTLILIAETAQVRDEWLRMLTVTINLSDIEPSILTKHNSIHEGVLSVTRQGHTKRCHAILVNHIVFFLKSPIDPTPMGYISVKGSKIREVTDSNDYDPEEQEFLKSTRCSSDLQDCSLAIYPKFSLNLDPVYLTLGSQQDTDGWIHCLSQASGSDQSSGTQFERTLAHLMISNSMASRKDSSHSFTSMDDAHSSGGCQWRENPIMLYSDRPIAQPLTSLPNETLKLEALELFKSVLLFTQVPIEPIAIDYHVSLLQNCLARFLRYPELRNEFFAQLIKQSTFVIHRCYSSKSSGSESSGCSSINQRSSLGSLSPSSSECQFIADLRLLNSTPNDRITRYDIQPTTATSQSNKRDKNSENTIPLEQDNVNPPSRSELLQVMQILAVAVSLNLPRGRLRWWLIDHLRKFANSETTVGKYALFTLKSIDRGLANGSRDNIPSRTEIVSILLRNPYDHSTPHSLPVGFADGSYLVVGADGSTTIEEFMTSLSKSINIRHSLLSDFYLFADDPSDSQELHILEPQRKILDVVGWWEQAFRQNNSGRHQNNRAMKLLCKKRLVLKAEEGETEQEKLLIAHQINHEIVAHRIPLNEDLILELSAIMTQLTFGDFAKSNDPKKMRGILDKIAGSFVPGKSGVGDHYGTEGRRGSDSNHELASQVVEHWREITGRSAQDCIRVYLNCIRRLKLDEH